MKTFFDYINPRNILPLISPVYVFLLQIIYFDFCNMVIKKLNNKPVRVVNGKQPSV